MKTFALVSTKICAALLLAGSVSNCGSMEMLFVNPGKFTYLNCADIAAKFKSTRERERELETLIERAERETFGVIVAAAAYRSEYLRTQGELKLLAETAQSKGCTTDPITGELDGGGPRR